MFYVVKAPITRWAYNPGAWWLFDARAEVAMTSFVCFNFVEEQASNPLSARVRL